LGLSGGDLVLAREPADDLLPANPVLGEVDLRWPGVSLNRCELAEGTVRVPLQNAVTWSGLQVRRLSLCGPVVLVDHAEHLPALHRRVQRYDGRLVMIGWLLVPGLVRPVPVVVPGVGPQHCPQVSFAVDKHPVRALGPDGPHPAFGVTVGPHRRLHLIQMIGTDVSG
jgi:hypothetical protein